ncbi:hypothetical protein [Mycobacterium sp. shizuoka-1]|uniref:hypothetical protein n=1 Tax=Mycobacterium sp. shizuoka-1 TaxID=2039281 RepID=UPI000C0661B3|nr:hypothetical protein [Mycobacterium sp. shizuoka-1]GAY19326.1 putative replication protein RepA [Mycobacterium sp. shizuoka-1]
MWTSRAGWLDELGAWADTEVGRAACARKVRASLLLRVAAALAAHADHSTGRHCAVTNTVVAKTAGCTARTVSTVRAVLREAGFAVEVHRGTGSAAAPQSARRPSVWHLVSRRVPVDNRAVFHLPPSRRDRRSSLVGNTSPSTRKRAPKTKDPSKKQPQRARRYAPRPLHVQQLAAGVMARSRGLSHVHTGHICDALTRSGLDLDTWTARAITDALDADMRTRGWSWPDRIERPGPFLASRLRRLPVRPCGAPRGGVTAASLDSSATPSGAVSVLPSPVHDTSPEPISVPASASHRAAAMEYFRLHRSKKPGI